MHLRPFMVRVGQLPSLVSYDVVVPCSAPEEARVCDVGSDQLWRLAVRRLGWVVGSLDQHDIPPDTTCYGKGGNVHIYTVSEGLPRVALN